MEEATPAQYEQGELTKWLADPILSVARAPDRGSHRPGQGVRHLCGNGVLWAFDHEGIKRILRWLDE